MLVFKSHFNMFKNPSDEARVYQLRIKSSPTPPIAMTKEELMKVGQEMLA